MINKCYYIVLTLFLFFIFSPPAPPSIAGNTRPFSKTEVVDHEIPPDPPFPKGEKISPPPLFSKGEKISPPPLFPKGGIRGGYEKIIEDAHSTDDVALLNKYFNPLDVAKARSYRKKAMVLSINRVLLKVIFLAFLILSGLNLYLEDLSLRSAGYRRWLATLIAFSAIYVLFSCLSFPFTYLKGFMLTHNYGLSHQTFISWISDCLKARAVEMMVLGPVITLIYVFMRHFPRLWWMATGIVICLLIPFLVIISPVIIDPLYYDFKNLEPGEMREEIVDIASRAGLEVDEVVVAEVSKKSSRINAYYTGLGPTRRIVLYDTLFGFLSLKEMKVLLSHEVAHHTHRHLIKGVMMASLASLLILLLSHLALKGAVHIRYLNLNRMGDIRGLPLFLLVITVILLLGMPAKNYISRRIESQADRTALEICQYPEEFIRLEIKLTLRNLNDPAPSPFIRWLFADHPTPLERIKMARRMNLIDKY